MPPLPFTSREIVDGDLPSRRAIDRRDSPPAKPREISSRSVNDNRNCDRFRSAIGGRSFSPTVRPPPRSPPPTPCPLTPPSPPTPTTLPLTPPPYHPPPS